MKYKTLYFKLKIQDVPGLVRIVKLWMDCFNTSQVTVTEIREGAMKRYELATEILKELTSIKQG